MQNKRIVFDIDGTIATAQGEYEREKRREKHLRDYGEEFVERHTLHAYNHPHLIFPSYYALLRYLNQQGWIIDFFSSGIEERNIELIDGLMKRSFENEASIPEYRVFSRQHAIDTDEIKHNSYHNPNADEEAKAYQSFFYGQRKKKLGGVIVDEADVPYTLLVDDDTSYMVAGEEKNFIGLHYSYEYPLRYRPFDPLKHYQSMHNAYYLAALLDTIVERAEQKQITLADAAYEVQITDYGIELSREVYIPPSIKESAYYDKGLKLLQTLEPELTYYLPEESEEPEDPSERA